MSTTDRHQRYDRQAAPLPINQPEGAAMAQVAIAADTLTRAQDYLDTALIKGPHEGFSELRVNERHIVRGTATERITRARAALKAALIALKQADADLRAAGEEDR